MRLKTFFTTAAAAVALVVGGTARAGHDFTVSAAPDPMYFTTGGGTTILDVGSTGTTTLNSGQPVILPTSGLLNADLSGIDVNFAKPTITSTLTSPEAVSFTYGYDLTIRDMDTNTTGTALVTGTIGGTASDSGSVLTAFNFAAHVTGSAADATDPSLMHLGKDLFAISLSTQSQTGTAPSVNAGYGTLVLHIADPIPAVPEPASIALLGLGGLGILGMLRRRRSSHA